MNTDCPKCGCEDAFFNGVCWECPNCDYEWGAVNRKVVPIYITLDDNESTQ